MEAVRTEGRSALALSMFEHGSSGRASTLRVTLIAGVMMAIGGSVAPQWTAYAQARA